METETETETKRGSRLHIKMIRNQTRLTHYRNAGYNRVT